MQPGTRSSRTIDLTRDIVRSVSGNVLPLTGAAMFVLAGMVGGGVDISRSYMVKNRLQNACDAGVLAGRRAVGDNGFDDTAEAQANAYFDANFDDNEQSTSTSQFVPTSTDNGNTVEALASATLPTVVMGIFGYDNVNLSVSCSASMSVGNSDVMMVLDSTGSMGTWSDGETRMQSLQNAMKNFYDTVDTATNNTNARIRFGFVPYSSSVNVGHLIYAQNPDYLVDSWPIQSREAVFETVTVDEFAGWEDPEYSTGSGTSSITYGDSELESNTRYRNRNQCENALPDDEDWANYGGSSTETDTEINDEGQQVTTTTESQWQRSKDYFCVRHSRNRYYQYYRYLWRQQLAYDYEIQDPIYVTTETLEFDHWLYKEVEYDTSTFKTFASAITPTGYEGGNESSTWEGCIEERSTVSDSSFSYSTTWGLSPSDAYDLDIDLVPDTSDDETKWAPLWPDLAYYRTSWVNTWGGGYYRISDVDESLTGDDPYSFCPQQARLLSEMTETEFDNYADSLFPEGNTYHDIGMIWGGRLISKNGLFASNVNSSPTNGGSVARHVIFMTDGYMEPNNSVQSAYGIEFHDRRVTDNGSSNHADRHTERLLAVCSQIKAQGTRIWVIAFGPTLTSELETCASSQSAFTANNADELNETFQEIARNVGELRVVQ